MSSPTLMRGAAADLVGLAGEVESVVGSLVPAGGEETWLGPAAEDFRAAVRRRDAQAEELAGVLRRWAGDLDAAADLLEIRVAEAAERARLDHRHEPARRGVRWPAPRTPPPCPTTFTDAGCDGRSAPGGGTRGTGR